MASGIFAVLDDIAALMDDVAVTSKIAASKTAGILGDDLAVNAEKATGFVASREIPVLWAITKGSLVNKVILVPIALLLNNYFPIALPFVLVLGGFYLAYEGVEKILAYLFHPAKSKEDVLEERELNATAAEKAKIKAAITTDFILSIEIVIIALGTVLEESLPIQIITVAFVAILATIGVYGIVALIVRMDDVGYALIRKGKDKGILTNIGRLLIRSLPFVIKALGYIGTVALLLVSGGIFEHHSATLHHALPQFPEMIKQLIWGLVAGTAVWIVITGIKRVFATKSVNN